ncbi:MAG: type II toxin-antitoxin system RelE/ParE family toxin [Actinomycetota bacterium]
MEAVLGRMATNPRRAGKPLVGELLGLYSARRGDYRITYEIPEAEQVVIVHRVQHRGTVHRPRRRFVTGRRGGVEWPGATTRRAPKSPSPPRVSPPRPSPAPPRHLPRQEAEPSAPRLGWRPWPAGRPTSHRGTGTPWSTRPTSGPSRTPTPTESATWRE